MKMEALCKQIGTEQQQNTTRWHKIAYNWQLSCMGNKPKSHTDKGYF